MRSHVSLSKRAFFFRQALFSNKPCIRESHVYLVTGYCLERCEKAEKVEDRKRETETETETEKARIPV